MAPPGNGIFVVRGEMAILMTAMRRGQRWSGSASLAYRDDADDADPLLRQFGTLRQSLANVEDLRLLEPIAYLQPFLDVIRSEETSGPVTSLALSTLNKFLAFGLIDPTHAALPATVEAIADAVTHARFVGTDQTSDGIVLMKIVQVLRTLMLSPEGAVLTNESVCEVMLSCFRICFEGRLSELLCQTAESALRDIVLLLFMRLPQFAEERTIGAAGFVRRLKMMAGGATTTSTTTPVDPKRRKKPATVANKPLSRSASARKASVTSTGSSGSAGTTEAAVTPPQAVDSGLLVAPKAAILSTTPATPLGNIVDMQGKMMQTTPLSSTTTTTVEAVVEPETLAADGAEADVEDLDDADSVKDDGSASAKKEDFVNSMGVRFTPVSESESTTGHVPYGLPCVRELLRFLVSLCNPLDKQNTDRMMHIGLGLLTVALEVGADHVGQFESLMALVRDDMCRNLFALLNLERVSIFAADLQVCFLLFESLRVQLKFHLEYYLARLFDIIGGDNARIAYEKRELALDNVLQLCRIPGFAAELYTNYDCNLYCTDLLDQLVQLLAKLTLSAGPYQQQMLYSVHQMSLDGLVSIVRGIESNCRALAETPDDGSPGSAASLAVGRHSRTASTIDAIVLDATTSEPVDGSDTNDGSGPENVSSFSSVNAALAAGRRSAKQPLPPSSPATPSADELLLVKQQKRTLTQGTELFNQRPDKGIAYLQEHGLLRTPLDAAEVARFLRENAGLDKAMIGEYISKKKNVELRILENFVESFDFRRTRIDLALRQYLETFRLPGEAPLIFLVMEHFAEHWHKCNDDPFANTDSAFRLAYAIIMLNMDQHNHNAKRLNVPMRAEDFSKNLRGLNGTEDFDQTMLLDIYNGIRTDEIIMPAEQTGLVRENYLWKVLLRRGQSTEARFAHVRDARYDRLLFQLVWGPTLSAISYMFDKTPVADVAGLRSAAAIADHYALHADFDGMLLTLCKFTGLLLSADGSLASSGGGSGSSATASNSASSASEALLLGSANADIAAAVALAQNGRAQLALQTVFGLLHSHADCARDGWRPVLDVCVQLFRAKLLPRALIEVEDFCEPGGRVLLAAEKPPAKPADAGIFSSLYSYLASDGLGRQPTYEEQEYIKIARRCVRDCHIHRMIDDSRFLQFDALRELLRAFGAGLRPPGAHKSLGHAYGEEVVVFQMEWMVRVLVQNRDRVLPVWQTCRDQMYALLSRSASCGYAYLLNRSTVALLKLAIYLMRNEDLCSAVLQSLRMLLSLKPAVLLATSRQISVGIYELLKTSAQNIHSEADWQIVFTLLECVGAGAIPPEADEALGQAMQSLLVGNAVGAAAAARSEGAASSEPDENAITADRGYTSDSDLTGRQPTKTAQAENWILVQKDNAGVALLANSSSSGSDASTAHATGTTGDVTQLTCPNSPVASLRYPCRLLRHSPFALVKCWESLAFIVRNVAHITPYNFESCVRCIRTFVEASLNVADASEQQRTASNGRGQAGRRRAGKSPRETSSHDDDDDQSSTAADDELHDRYELIAEQLLDLMHTLHTRTAQIFRWWAEEGGSQTQAQQTGLWPNGWCPLLQGIARLVNDRRREVRTHAIEYLQRALLVHDLQALTGPEWQSCFKQVVFPLLFDLLAESAPQVEAGLLDESRIRTATIMWKVFLHHLTPLIGLPGFGELWLEILDYMERFMGVGSDMLHEAMREGLKNMLLVVNMHPVRVFHSNAALWNTTWERIGQFMPQLKDELFKDKGANERTQEQADAHPLIEPAAGPTADDQPIVPVVPAIQLAEPVPVVPQSIAAQSHIPYLVSQAQQQFALMEQQYAQQCTGPAEDPEQPLLVAEASASGPAPVLNQYAFTMDIGDSESELSIQDKLPTAPIVDPLHSHLAQSFASEYAGAVAETDIYADYLQNPYNITAAVNPVQPNQDDQPSAPFQSDAELTANATPVASSMFGSYFGSDRPNATTSSSSGTAAEMLFSAP